MFLFADTKDSSYIRNKRRGPPLESRTSNTLASLGEGLRKVSLYETHTGKAFADAEPFGSFIKWIAEPNLPGRYSGSIEMPCRQVQMEMLEYHFRENYETMPIIPKRYFLINSSAKEPLLHHYYLMLSTPKRVDTSLATMIYPNQRSFFIEPNDCWMISWMFLVSVQWLHYVT